METSPTTTSLFKALDSFHAATPLVKATKENPYFKSKYADYNLIVSETRADLAKNGLRVKQAVSNIDGKTAIYTRLTHVDSGEFMATLSPVAHKDNDPQSQGSGITYGKRYAYVAILDLLVDQDDDGSLAAGLNKKAEEQKAVDDAIAKLQAAKDIDELKNVFIKLGNLVADKRVVNAKELRKAELLA